MFAGQYDACIDEKVEEYLNRPEVQQAMHANTSGILPGPWTDCTDTVKYYSEDIVSSMIPVYMDLLDTGASLISQQHNQSDNFLQFDLSRKKIETNTTLSTIVS